jgi:uncharacterized protein (TIGR01777 family)
LITRTEDRERVLQRRIGKRCIAEREMKVIVSGADGLVGTALRAALEGCGHDLTRLVRGRPPGPREVFWDPTQGRIDRIGLEGHDAVVHLAGESLVGRWSEEKKCRIRDSRVRGTRLLVGAVCDLARPPQVLISASAVGYYGPRGSAVLRETDPPGTGFLSGVCRDWEAEAEPVLKAGIRLVLLRSGLILAPLGGALAIMLPAFRRCLGSTLGDGSQWMSWISLRDAVGVIRYALDTEALQGAVNNVAPHPVTNAHFTRALGRALSRPAFLRVPGFALRVVLGEMADELLLTSTRAEPDRLTAAGYRFRDPTLERTLSRLVGPTSRLTSSNARSGRPAS